MLLTKHDAKACTSPLTNVWAYQHPHTSRLTFSIIKIFTSRAIAYAAGLTGCLFVTSAFALQPYTATYEFTTNEKIASTATRVLSQVGNEWTYAVKTTVLAVGKASESSQFNVENNRVKSVSHLFSLKVPFNTKLVKMQFTPDTVFVNKNDVKSSFANTSDALDELNSEFQLRMDLKAHQLKPYYNIAKDDGIEKVKMVEVGKEKVTTPYGVFDTIKIQRVHSSPKRTTYFWLAPELDYLPIRLAHNDGSLRFNMVLNDYKSK